MSLPTIHFGRPRTRPKHRAETRRNEQDENRRLRAQLVGVQGYIVQLEHSLAESRSREAEAGKVVDCQDAGLEQARREIKRLTEANRAWEARYANEHPVSVKAPRDLRPDDNRPTVPHGIDVRPLREATGISPVIRIADKPAVDDPRTPTWVPGPDSETTQSLRVA